MIQAEWDRFNPIKPDRGSTNTKVTLKFTITGKLLNPRRIVLNPIADGIIPSLGNVYAPIVKAEVTQWDKRLVTQWGNTHVTRWEGARMEQYLALKMVIQIPLLGTGTSYQTLFIESCPTRTRRWSLTRQFQYFG